MAQGLQSMDEPFKGRHFEREMKAAKAFFRKALKTQGRPSVSITLDGYAASHCAVRELPAQNSRWKDTRLRSSRYLNNIVEQDHRGVRNTRSASPSTAASATATR